MNVLGKIKSKKQNVSNTQTSQIQEKVTQQKKQQLTYNNSKKFEQKSYQSQIPLNKKTRNVEQKKTFRLMKPVEQVDYITNTNVLTKHKEIAIKQKQSTLMMTASTPSNNFFSKFQTNKPSKNSNSGGVYFDSNPSGRSSTFLCDSNTTTNQRPKNKRTDSYESEQEMNVDFDFLLSNKEKKQVRKSIISSKGKIQNEKQIQSDLKAQNDQVICFYVKKCTIYGDIFMLQGEVQSLKRGYIQVDLYQTKKKVYNKMKIKLSCGRDVLSSPEIIGRIYISQLSFLSQTEGMIVHQYFLRVMEKNRKFNK